MYIICIQHNTNNSVRFLVVTCLILILVV